MRIIGMDICRSFAELVVWEDGKLHRLGRVDMRRDALETFGRKLKADDVIVLEATGNTGAAVEVLKPYVAKVVVANPKQVRLIAHGPRSRPMSSMPVCSRSSTPRVSLRSGCPMLQRQHSGARSRGATRSSSSARA